LTAAKTPPRHGKLNISKRNNKIKINYF